ncbi:MAG: hypothetical protein II244_07655 [Clostridia bacterium]|nr:hypothetical protein [Clostridia bacterium]
MGVFTMLSAKIISTNCNPSLYGVYYLTETRCHSTTRKSKIKGKIFVINFRC